MNNGAGRQAVIVAGLLWIGVAALGAYLAYLQWTTAQVLDALGGVSDAIGGTRDDLATINNFRTYALVNGASAAITLYFGASLLMRPTRGRLDASAAWGVLSVLGVVFQVASGVTNGLVFLSGLGAGIAAVLSWMARDVFTPAEPSSTPVAMPASPPVAQPPTPALPSDPTPRQVQSGGTAAVAPFRCPHCTQPVDARASYCPNCGGALKLSALRATPTPVLTGAAPERKSGPPILEFAIVGLILATVVVGALLLGPRFGIAGFASATPTPSPLPTRAPTLAPQGSGRVSFGLGVDPDTLAVTQPTTQFLATDAAIAWSAEFREPAGATTLDRFLVRRNPTGAEQIMDTYAVKISNPSFDVVANTEDLATLAGNEPGIYVMRFLRGTTVLAEGSFELVAP